MKYTSIDSALFFENRKRFNEKLKPSSMVIIHSNDEFPRSGDQAFPFHQNPDMFWLSGIDQEESILILIDLILVDLCIIFYTLYSIFEYYFFIEIDCVLFLSRFLFFFDFGFINLLH